MTDQRERLIHRVARSILWGRADSLDRDNARRIAVHVVTDLLDGSAEGKATERAVKTILTRLEKSA